MYTAKLGDTVTPIQTIDEIESLNFTLTDADKETYPNGWELTPESLEQLRKENLERKIDDAIRRSGLSDRNKLVVVSNGAYVALLGAAALIVNKKNPDNEAVSALLDQWEPLAKTLIDDFLLGNNIASVVGLESIVNNAMSTANHTGNIVSQIFAENAPAPSTPE